MSSRKVANGSETSAFRSRFEPTEKKKTPSRNDLIGSIVVCTARRYSVSANSSPATKAPRAIESCRSRYEAGADGHEQRRGDEAIVVVRLRYKTKERLENIAPDSR